MQAEGGEAWNDVVLVLLLEGAWSLCFSTFEGDLLFQDLRVKVKLHPEGKRRREVVSAFVCVSQLQSQSYWVDAGGRRVETGNS